MIETPLVVTKSIPRNGYPKENVAMAEAWKRAVRDTGHKCWPTWKSSHDRDWWRFEFEVKL